MHGPELPLNQVKLREVAGVVFLECSGCFSSRNDNYVLQGEVARLLAGGKTQLVLDFDPRALWSEMTMAAMLSIHKSIRGAHGKLKLVVRGQSHKDILRVTRLESYFEVYPNEEEALASFSQPDNPPRGEP